MTEITAPARRTDWHTRALTSRTLDTPSYEPYKRLALLALGLPLTRAVEAVK